jgi:hypothetical protein
MPMKNSVNSCNENALNICNNKKLLVFELKNLIAEAKYAVFNVYVKMFTSTCWIRLQNLITIINALGSIHFLYTVIKSGQIK